MYIYRYKACLSDTQVLRVRRSYFQLFQFCLKQLAITCLLEVCMLTHAQKIHRKVLLVHSFFRFMLLLHDRTQSKNGDSLKGISQTGQATTWGDLSGQHCKFTKAILPLPVFRNITIYRYYLFIQDLIFHCITQYIMSYCRISSFSEYSFIPLYSEKS